MIGIYLHDRSRHISSREVQLISIKMLPYATYFCCMSENMSRIKFLLFPKQTFYAHRPKGHPPIFLLSNSLKPSALIFHSAIRRWWWPCLPELRSRRLACVFWINDSWVKRLLSITNVEFAPASSAFSPTIRAKYESVVFSRTFVFKFTVFPMISSPFVSPCTSIPIIYFPFSEKKVVMTLLRTEEGVPSSNGLSTMPQKK